MSSSPDFFHRIKVIAKQVAHDRGKEAKCSVQMNSLCNIISSPENLQQLQENWEKVANELCFVFASKCNQHLKNSSAKCMGEIGYLVAAEGFGSFVKYLQEKYNACQKPEERGFYLVSLHEFMRCFVENNKCVVPENIKTVMDFAKAFLDTNESNLELIIVLDICLTIAKFYPAEFNSYVHDICDFVIGWFMDRDEPRFVEEKCRETIRAFRPFFRNDVNEALVFLDSLMDDFLLIVEDDDKENFSKSDSSKLESAISSLIVFEEIYKSAIDQHNVSAVVELILKIEKKFDAIEKRLCLIDVKQGNQCAIKLADVFFQFYSSSINATYLDKCLRLVDHCLHSSQIFPDQFTDLLVFCNKMLAENVNKVKILKKFITTSDSIAPPYLHSFDDDLCKKLCFFFSKFLDTSNLETIQATYRLIVDELQNQFNYLKKLLDNKMLYNPITTQENFTIALLASLKPVAAAKNSIIVLRGLDPSLFSFLFYTLPIHKKWLITFFPKCFYLLLCLAKTFAETHNHFIAHSELFTSTIKSSFMIEAPTAKFFGRILFVLSMLLSNVEIMSGEAVIMVMKWLENVCKNTGELPKGVLSNPIVTEISKILLSMFADNIFSKKFELNASLLFSIKHFHAFSLLVSNTDSAFNFINRLKFTMEKVELKECAAIVNKIPSTVLMRVLIKSKDTAVLPAVEQSLLGKAVMAPFQFQMLTNFFVNCVAPSFSLKTSFNSNWFIDSADFLYRDFILEQRSFDKFAKQSQQVKALADISTLHKWHFIINHFALFCVENRLKTPIGKAMDTFSKFEGAIKTATAELLVHTSKLSEEYCNKVDCQLRMFEEAIKARRNCQKGFIEITASKESIEDEENEQSETRNLLSKREECLRVDLLLSLIDALDKLMVYAVRGSVHNFAEISQGSSQFFYTNESTCQGWMSRITPPLMATCFAAGRYSQIVRLSVSIFTEIEQRLEIYDEKKVVKIDPATTLIVCWLIRAMVELSAAQEICGVYRWVKEVLNVEMTWIRYAARLAAGSFEAALNGFSRAVKEEKLHHYVVKAIREMSLKAVKSIRNVEITSQYCTVLFSESGKSTGKDDDFEKLLKKTESNYGFEEIQLKSALALSEWSDFESYGTQKLNDLEGLTSNCCLPWNVQKYSEEVELNMLRIFICSSTNRNKTESRTELSALSDDLAQLLQIGITSCRDDALTLAARNSAFNLVHGWLSEQKRSVLYPVDNRKTKNAGVFETLDFSSILDVFDANDIKIGSRIEIGQILCIWLDRISAFNSQTTRTSHQHQKLNALGGSFRQMLINGHAEMAQLAARSDNIALSQFHLVKYTHLLNSNELNQYQKFGNDTAFISPPSKFEEHQLMFTNGYYHQHNITTPSIATRNVNNTADLREFLRASKLVWQFFDGKTGQDGAADVRFNCFGDMLDVLCRQLDSSRTGVQQSISDTPQHKALLARMCICLGRWNSALTNAINILFQKHATCPDSFLQQIVQSRELLEDNCVGLSMEEALSGSFFLTASSLATGFVKTHRVMADWVFSQMYEEAIDESDDSEEALRISVNETALLRRMGLNLSALDQRKMLTLLGKCDTLERFSSELASQIGSKCALQSIFESPDFVQTWIMVKRRQFKLFETLLNSSIRVLENLSTPTDSTDNYQRPIVVMSTCLRVLKMLTDQPDWFSKVVELNWIVRIQCDIWKEIIPRLFALLNHSNSYVRQTVCRILERIGESSPYAICFPSITNGGANGLCDSMINKENEDDVNIERTKWSDGDARNANVLAQHFQEHMNIKDSADQDYVQSSCQQLVAKMCQAFPQMFKDATNFCMEMHKISLLHEEQWLFVLSSLDVIVGRVVRQQQAHLEVEGDDYLGIVEQDALKRRNDCVILMVYNILKDLYELTCGKPAQTNNEKQFRLVYKSMLTVAIEQYDLHCGTDLATAWEPLRKVIESMNMRAMKRSALCFSAQDISAYLSQLSSSSIPIPGLLYNRFQGGVVTIHKVHKNVYVLPTKTRPKKITFIGSDGKEYSFLFKCHEDLHLDERVMQLLRVCNMILSDRKRPVSDMQFVVEHGEERYSCSSYSVTPLGPRCGLIEWVDGATPLFQIYRKWMVREMEAKENRRIQADLRSKNHHTAVQAMVHTNKYVRHVKSTDQRNRLLMKEISSSQLSSTTKKRQQQHADPPPSMAEPERPTELYQNKLKAIFAHEGLSKDKMRNRQQWPLYCQKQALCEMINGTPRDILAKELWMRAGDSATWWRVTERFARTAAAASMVGSVIGLGDRHLDNVLVNLSSGQIVHVDYNVCFERGRQLRIPEVIPFRLTGNIARALGPTQIEGTFRESCIDVLSKFRQHREVIVSTLDVFVNDPLLDWSTEKEFRFVKSTLNVGVLFAVYGGGNVVYNQDSIEKNTDTPLMSTNQAKRNLMNAVNHLFELGSCGVDEMLDAPIDPCSITSATTMHSANQSCYQANRVTERIRRKLNGHEIIESTTTLSPEDERMPWSKFVRIGDENLPETERMTAEEQVDFLIKKAMNVTNLALLYEGWTAWV